MPSGNRLAAGGGGRGAIASSLMDHHRSATANRVGKEAALMRALDWGKEKKGATPGGEPSGETAGGSGVGGMSALVPVGESGIGMANANASHHQNGKRNKKLRTQSTTGRDDERATGRDGEREGSDD